MSRVGQVFPSEMTKYIDPKTGREVIQLTSSGSNVHMYFTDNSFYSGDKAILYRRSEGNLKDPGVGNLFKMDLESGERTQITDFEAWGLGEAKSYTKSIDGTMIALVLGNDLYALFPGTGELRLLARGPAGFRMGHPSISFDNRYVAITATSVPAESTKKYTNENYNGFKENFYAIKVGRIIIARTDGSGDDTVFEDTHWLGHIQFAPDTNEFLTYCHEGPWNYVQQRIWMFNTITRHTKPCYVQEEKDSIGHEFWTRDGLVFYDNRGRGHDGTITSDKTQAVAIDYNGPDDIPEVGFIDKNLNIVRKLDLPYYCNHYHANNDNTLLAADAVNDLVLIDISTDVPNIQSLCAHDTSWRYQGVHPHPTWSWSNNAILFASDRLEEGRPQLYLVRMEM